MLPILHKQRYQKFRVLLEHLHVAGVQLNKPALRELTTEVHQFFQQQIVMAAGDLEPADAARVQSYQTEMSKQLQMVGMDVMFLQAARQQETVTARQRQMSDRIQTLIGYCDALL